MSARVYVAALDAEELTALIATLRHQAPFAILERPDKVDFPGRSETIAAAAWLVGRVFGERAELYWEQKDTAYQVRLTCTDGSLLPNGSKEALTLDGLKQDTAWYYLWGEDDVAIGGRLDYSRIIPGSGRGQLGVTEYRDQSGRLVFYHYIGLRREVEHG